MIRGTKTAAATVGSSWGTETPGQHVGANKATRIDFLEKKVHGARSRVRKKKKKRFGFRGVLPLAALILDARRGGGEGAGAAAAAHCCTALGGPRCGSASARRTGEVLEAACVPAPRPAVGAHAATWRRGRRGRRQSTGGALVGLTDRKACAFVTDRGHLRGAAGRGEALRVRAEEREDGNGMHVCGSVPVTVAPVRGSHRRPSGSQAHDHVRSLPLPAPARALCA